MYDDGKCSEMTLELNLRTSHSRYLRSAFSRTTFELCEVSQSLTQLIELRANHECLVKGKLTNDIIENIT